MHTKSTHTKTKPRTGARIENHVAMVTAYYLPSHGGIENHVKGLSERLAYHGWSVDIHCAHTGPGMTVENGSTRIFYSRSWLNPMNNPVSPAMLRTLLQSNAQVIHAHGIYQLTSLIAKIIGNIKRVPVILSVHGLADFSGLLWILQQVYETTVLRVKPRISHYVASTQAEKSFLMSLSIDRDDISVIPNAIDTSYWTPRRETARVVGEQCTDLLFVGHLIPRKQCDLLIKAFAEFLKESPDSRLSIVGTGPEQDTLRMLTRDLEIEDFVRFLGRISKDELRERCRKAKAFVLPSRVEGLPTVLLEAMACGTLAISSDLPGILDLIDHGQNGFLFQEGNVVDLIRVLLKVDSMTTDIRNRISAEATETIRNRFSWTHVARRINEVYSEVIRKRNNHV